MNFEKQGLNIAKIRHINRKKSFKEIGIYVEPDFRKTHDITTFDEIRISDDDAFEQIIQHIPYKNSAEGQTRQIAYVSGASGSGKSYYCAQYIIEYVKLFPKNRILVFSALDCDPVIDNIKGNITRVKLDDDFANSEVNLKDYENTLCLFDDCEGIPNKMISSKLNSILHALLTRGRHVSASMLICTHNTCAGQATKLLLVETHSVTIFKTMGFSHVSYLLKNYFSMDKEDIQKLRKLPGRWMTIVKTSTRPVVLYEQGAYMV